MSRWTLIEIPFILHGEPHCFFRYISNDCRRFNVYVANWVGRIRSFSKPCQWNYVPTVYNPADLATTDFHASDLPYSMLIRRPSLLPKDPVMNKNVQSKSDQSPLVCAKEDREVKKETISILNRPLNGNAFQVFLYSLIVKGSLILSIWNNLKFEMVC